MKRITSILAAAALVVALALSATAAPGRRPTR